MRGGRLQDHRLIRCLGGSDACEERAVEELELLSEPVDEITVLLGPKRVQSGEDVRETGEEDWGESGGGGHGEGGGEGGKGKKERIAGREETARFKR